jgi:amidase
MVPSVSGTDAWANLSVDGPMARTVSDCALMLAAVSGPDARSPISGPRYEFPGTLERDFSGTRVAWSRDLGGLPVDPRVTRTIEAQRHVFEDLGCIVDDSEPDFTDADEAFKTLRAWQFETNYGELLDKYRSEMKNTVIWNIEEGRKLSGPDISRAVRGRTALYHRVREFMEGYEFLILPVSQVLPFDVKQRWVEKINDVRMHTYIDWMKSCYFITLTGLPAISVPCGFTEEGLPVGVQIVGRWRDDSGVLQLAHAFEQATGFWKTRPPVSD